MRIGLAVGDRLFAALVVIAGTVAWAPLIGVAAARETLDRRRAERFAYAAIRRAQGKVWARHARRCAAPAVGWAAARSNPPRGGW